MKNRELPSFRHYIGAWVICVTAALVLEAHAQETSTNNWHPDTSRLDSVARIHSPFMGDAGSTLAHDVKTFYQLLHDKQWRKTYELRARAFREDVPESEYLSEAKEVGKLWGLANYDVLSVGFSNSYGATNTDQATLICKFTELPDHAVCYSTVFWHREGGVWKCLSAGPVKLTILHGTRPPVIDWR